MYTLIYYNEETLDVIDTLETNSMPKVGGDAPPHYIIKGEFDGVVDPSQGIKNREQQLEEEVKKMRERLQSTEDAFFLYTMQ